MIWVDTLFVSGNNTRVWRLGVDLKNCHFTLAHEPYGHTNFVPCTKLEIAHYIEYCGVLIFQDSLDTVQNINKREHNTFQTNVPAFLACVKQVERYVFLCKLTPSTKYLDTIIMLIYERAHQPTPLPCLNSLKTIMIRWMMVIHIAVMMQLSQYFPRPLEFPIKSLFLQKRKWPWCPGSWSPTLLWDGRPCWRRPLGTRIGQKVCNLNREEMEK